MPGSRSLAPILIRSLQVGETRVSLTYYPPHLHQPRHAHDERSASVVLAGALIEEWCAGSVSAGAFSLVRKPRGAAHETRYGPDGALILSATRGAPASTGRLPPLWTQRPSLDAFSVELLTGALLRGGPGADVEDVVEAMLADPGAAPDEGSSAWLRRMFDRLAEEPMTAPSVSALARELGVAPAYASRAFRACFGLTPSQHRRRARSLRAVCLLGNGMAPAAAAAAAGFVDQSHLNRDLRALLGVTPASVARSNPSKIARRIRV